MDANFFFVLISVIIGTLAIPILKRYIPIPYDIYRKLLHVGLGIIFMLAILLIKSDHELILLGITILLVRFFLLRIKTYRDIDKVNETKNYGTFWFVISFIFINIYLNPLQVAAKMTAISVLTFGDAAAALSGKYFLPKRSFKILKCKTLKGSLAMFIVALFLVITCIYIYDKSKFSLLEIILVGNLVALLAALAEMISDKGVDNFFVPFVVAIVIPLFYQNGGEEKLSIALPCTFLAVSLGFKFSFFNMQNAIFMAFINIAILFFANLIEIGAAVLVLTSFFVLIDKTPTQKDLEKLMRSLAVFFTGLIIKSIFI